MFRGKYTRISAILLSNEIFAVVQERTFIGIRTERQDGPFWVSKYRLFVAALVFSGKEIHQDFFDVVIPSGVGILHPEGLQAKFSANLLFFLFSLPQDFLF